MLNWFDQMGFDFVNSIPKATALDEVTVDEPLFTQKDEGSWFDHLLVQSGMLLSGGKEGGFFIMIGEKRSSGQEHQSPKRDMDAENGTLG